MYISLIILCIEMVISISVYALKMPLIDRMITDVMKVQLKESKKIKRPAPLYRFVKRAFDIIVSSASIFILSPILLTTAIMLRIDGVGPLFVVGKIIGYKGRPIRVYMFNTIKKIADDKPIRSNFGEYIYKTLIYYLPMCFAVLKGDMSLVGLERIHELDIDRNELNEYNYFKPGIVSLMSICGNKVPVAVLNKIYSENAGLKLDLAMILYAVKMVYKI